MPHNFCQWMAYIGAVAVGVAVAAGVQNFFMETLWSREKVIERAAKALNETSAVNDAERLIARMRRRYLHLVPGLHEPLGRLEIILYSSSIVFEHPEFIGIWFATKYVSSYRAWSDDPLGRMFYNRSLFGSGVNILIGFFTGRLARWAIWYFGSR